jgi:hypothetical protein
VLDTTLGDTVAGKLDLRFAGLRAAGDARGDGMAALPTVALQVDFNRDATGRVAVKIPVAITDLTSQRVSDLELAVNAGPASAVAAAWQVDAKLGSQNLYLPDLQALAALGAETSASVAPAPAPEAEVKPAPGPAQPVAPEPLWAGVTGGLELSLARLLVLPGIDITNTTGRFALTREELKLAVLPLLTGSDGPGRGSGDLR